MMPVASAKVDCPNNAVAAPHSAFGQLAAKRAPHPSLRAVSSPRYGEKEWRRDLRFS